MLTPSRALVRAERGEPLPDVFPILAHRGIRIRRGEVTMIAGQPNAGKSMIALFYCLRLIDLGERALYFSADSNESTQGARMAAIVTGHKTRSIEASLTSGGLVYYQDALAEIDLRLDFNSNPTLTDIELTLDAYDELYGQNPSVMVIDNLMNVEGIDGENEKAGLIEIQKHLKYWSRDRGMAVLVLHHCSEAEGKPHLPPGRKAVQQKVSELPEMILTVAYDEGNSLFGVAAVKNRHGRADPAAQDPTWLWADMDTGRFFDDRYAAVIAGAV